MRNISDELRTALDMVEGYMVDPDKPWCASFARSEPNFSVKVTLVMRVLTFGVVRVAKMNLNQTLCLIVLEGIQDSNLLFMFTFMFSQLRNKQKARVGQARDILLRFAEFHHFRIVYSPPTPIPNYKTSVLMEGALVTSRIEFVHIVYAMTNA